MGLKAKERISSADEEGCKGADVLGAEVEGGVAKEEGTERGKRDTGANEKE